MKVRATPRFKSYRFAPMRASGMDKKTYRDLQKGKTCELPEKVCNKYPQSFEEVKEKASES